MGISPSITQYDVMKTISKWDWQKICEIRKKYSDDVYGFALDRETVKKLTSLDSEEVNELFYVLGSNDLEIVNSITLFLTLFMIGACNSLPQRLDEIFRLVDFFDNDSLSINEMTILMFCLARTLSVILSKPETCPTDLAVNGLVIELFNSVEKKKKSVLSKAEFSDIVTKSMKKLPNSKIDTIYSSFFQSSDEFPEDDFAPADDESISSLLIAPQPQPEPSQIQTQPDSNTEQQSNDVISILDEEENQSVQAKPVDRSNSLILQPISLPVPETKQSNNLEPISVPSRPTSASLRMNQSRDVSPIPPLIVEPVKDKQLTVLPPIIPQSSPRRELHSSTSQQGVSDNFASNLLSPRKGVIPAISPRPSQEKVPDDSSLAAPSLTDTHPSEPTLFDTSDKKDVDKEESELEQESSGNQTVIADDCNPPSVIALEPISNPTDHQKETEETILPVTPSPEIIKDSTVESIDIAVDVKNTYSSERNVEPIKASPPAQSLPEITVEKYCQLAETKALPIVEDPSQVSEVGLLEVSQISLSRLNFDGGSTQLFPYAEIKVESSEKTWFHRTELALDSDCDALWYTHFRGQICRSDLLRGNLRINIYFVEKLSPRLVSVHDDVLESKRISVCQAQLKDSSLVLKKPMKWVQLIGILTPSDNSMSSHSDPQGMYTITARYNPNPEASPRLPPHAHLTNQIPPRDPDVFQVTPSLPVDESQSPQDGNWPDYEYGSYYHEGGYYDPVTHVYLGNQYDHATGQYYQDDSVYYQEGQGDGQHYDYSSTHHQGDQYHGEEHQELSGDGDHRERDTSPDHLYETPSQPQPAQPPSYSLAGTETGEKGREEDQDEDGSDGGYDGYSISLPLMSAKPSSSQSQKKKDNKDSSPSSSSKTPLKKSSSVKDKDLNLSTNSSSSKKNLTTSEEESKSSPAPSLGKGKAQQSVAGLQVAQAEEVGYFEIQQLTLMRLKKVDALFSSGRIDPFATLTLSADMSSPSPLWSYTTDVQADRATQAEWVINSASDVPLDTLSGLSLHLVVKDHKGKNKVLGTVSISLRSLASKGSNWSVYEGQIMEKAKVAGEYSIRMRYKYKMVRKKEKA